MKLEDLDHRKNFGELLNKLGLYGFGVEIGVMGGAYSEAILEDWHGCGMFLVDPWKTWDAKDYIDGSANINFDQAFYETLDRMARKPGRAIVLRMTSDEAAKVIPAGMLDFVYIDGNHHEPQITRDLTNWYGKVKVGGIFAGHDYYDLNETWYRCEVKTAVDTFAKVNKLKLHITGQKGDDSWWIQK
jgi:hypothetical protein